MITMRRARRMCPKSAQVWSDGEVSKLITPAAPLDPFRWWARKQFKLTDVRELSPKLRQIVGK